MWNKKNIIITVVLVGLVGLAIVLGITQKNDTVTESGSSSTPDSTSQTESSLDIKNLYLYVNDIDIDSQETIETAVYGEVKSSLPEVKNLTGIVRKDSYNVSKNSDITLVTFLVDINSIQRTYKVSIGNDGGTGENSLYVLCPTEAELIYPAFDCKEDIDE